MTKLSALGNDYYSPAWDDLRIVPGAFSFAGSSDPTLRSWQPGGSGTTFEKWCFSVNDEVFFDCQIPHKYKQGTDLKPHLHWTPRQFGAAQSGNTVGWKFDYSIANVGSAFPASTTIDLTDTCTGTDHEHEVTSSGTISGTGLTVSCMLTCRLWRDTGTYTTTAASSPAILEFDIHYEIDGIGSDGEFSKS